MAFICHYISTFAKILRLVSHLLMTKQNEKAASASEATTNLNLVGVLRTLFRWKKTIITACLLAGVGSAVIVLLLPEYYQSNTVFFAASPDQSTPELMFGEGMIAPEFYGNENDIDRMLTVSSSNELVDFMVDSFDLYKRYDIDPESVKGAYSVRREFMSLFEVEKTKRDALQLSIEDQDPAMAQAMADAARNRIDELTQALIKNGQERAIQTFQGNINAKETQLNQLSDTLRVLRERYGIYNTEAQSESLTSLLDGTETRLISTQAKLEAFRNGSGRGFRDSVTIYQVKVAGLEEELNQLGQKLARFNQGLSQVQVNIRQYQEANNTLSEDKEKLKQYQAIFEAEIPAVILVEEAELPLIKSRPFRTLIVLASVFITFCFVAIGILLNEAFDDVDWRALYEGK